MNSELPKILLAFPTSDKKDYCLNEFLLQLSKLTYPNLHINIVDNSEKHRGDFLLSKLNQYNLTEKTSLTYYYRKNLNFRELIKDCHNIIRDIVLFDDYQYVYFLESDHFTAPNIIEHLLSFKKLIVGLPYFIGSNFESMYICSKIQMCGNKALEIALTANLGFLYSDGELKQTYQLGFGNILIHRSVLAQILFRIETEGKYNIETYFDDQFFYQDCKRLGIPVYVDTANMSYHWNQHWSKVIKK